jgi:hypothetical protein
MATSTSCADAVLAALTYPMGWVSLHVGDPGESGINEVTAAPYIRQSVTWAIPTGGVMSNATQLLIPLPAGIAVYYLGLWDSIVSGEFAQGQLLDVGGYPGVILTSVGSVLVPAGGLSVVVGSA